MKHKTKSKSKDTKTHTHEFLGNAKLVEEGYDRHVHRFAGVTTREIPLSGDDHKHVILTNTDFLDHHHVIGVETGPAIDIGNGKHVHFVTGKTTVNDEHFHEFTFATLLESPLLSQADDEEKSDVSKDFHNSHALITT